MSHTFSDNYNILFNKHESINNNNITHVLYICVKKTLNW